LFREDWNWAEFSVPPTTLVLFGDYAGAPLTSGQRGAVGIALAVDNLSDTITELSRKGVSVVDGPHDLSACSVAMILDPDQNPIFLHQQKDGSFGQAHKVRPSALRHRSRRHMGRPFRSRRYARQS